MLPRILHLRNGSLPYQHSRKLHFSHVKDFIKLLRRIEYLLMKLQLLVESQIYSFQGYVVYFIMNVSTQKQMDFNVG